MTQVINIQHWLDEDGAPAAPVRRRALRVARLIEYGGPLEIGYARETLVECSRRVDRRACEGLLWVAKADEGTLEAVCLVCRRERLVISGWKIPSGPTGRWSRSGPRILKRRRRW